MNWKNCATVVLAFLICLIWRGHGLAQDSSQDSKPTERWAVIFVGLPGDAEHEAALDGAATQLQTWLTETLEFPADHVIRKPSATTDDGRPLTAELMSSTLTDVKQKLLPNDSLWILLLGHGNYDGKRAWYHVAGRDPSNIDVGRWLDDVHCREQVIWLMQSSSGWFIKPLSRQGRIVITATAADDESNETEFPYAFATVSTWPIAKLDRDENKVVTVAELYMAVVEKVLRRFKSDNRLPTEHAQLDDNGDGIGIEHIPAKPSDAATPQGSKTKTDGDVARGAVLPYRSQR